MKERYRGSDDEVRALATYVKLMRAAECLTSKLHRHLAAVKLTVSQFGALEALYHLGPLCQRDLACKLLKSGGNITMVVANLERRELIKRRRDSNDRRYFVVELTDSGRKLISKLFPKHAEGIAEEFRILDPVEQQELQRLCRKLGLGAEC